MVKCHCWQACLGGRQQPRALHKRAVAVGHLRQRLPALLAMFLTTEVMQVNQAGKNSINTSICKINCKLLR